jgi:hypothetical protein
LNIHQYSPSSRLARDNDFSPNSHPNFRLGTLGPRFDDHGFRHGRESLHNEFHIRLECNTAHVLFKGSPARLCIRQHAPQRAAEKCENSITFPGTVAVRAGAKGLPGAARPPRICLAE